MKLNILLVFLLTITSTLAQKKAASEESLLATYQRELAFLMAQKNTLSKQSKLIEKEYGSKIIKAQRALDKTQNRLVTLTKNNESMSAKLLEAERSLENIESSNSLVETTLAQGKVSLSLSDELWEQKKSGEEKFEYLLSVAVDRLQASAQVKTSQGEFFTPEGKAHQGEMVQLGTVASFGKLNNDYYMLMPVGLGKLKVIGEPQTKKIQAVLEKSELKSLPVFLYETIQKGMEIKKERSFLEVVEAGGSIAWVIFFLGLLALVLVVARGMMLFGAAQFDKSLLNQIEEGDLNLVTEKVGKGKTPFDRVLKKTLAAQAQDRETRENVIHESILGELNFLDRFGAIILVMAAVAPLLGLLGTVTGMISTFDIITEFGTGDPKMLSSGISEALITTKLGLMVAIPSLLLGNLLSGWSSKIKVMLEREALRLSNRFDKEGGAHA